MRTKQAIITLLFFIVAIAAILTIYFLLPPKDLELYPLKHETITMLDEDHLIFFEGGFAVVGEYTSFYDDKGNSIDFPFNYDLSELKDFIITDLTDNYMLVNGVDIYKVEGKSLNKIFTLENSAVCLKEFGKFILLPIKVQDNKLNLKYLNSDDLELLDLGYDSDIYYLDADSDVSHSTLSILTLDASGSFPITKLLHYDSDLSLYGFTSAVDQVFYRIFRFPSNFILIGNQEIVCYNKESDIQWKIPNMNARGIQSVKGNLGLLIYIDQRILDDDGDSHYNGVFINNQGNRTNVNFPSQLTSIIPFGDRFISLQYGKNILILNKDGKVEGESYIGYDIKGLFASPYQTDHFYILKQDGTLQVYSTMPIDQDV